MTAQGTTPRGRDVEPGVLSAAAAKKLQVFPAGAVDLRRDVHRFLLYVEAKGLLRTKRGNDIPKTAARRLAKILSWSGEADALEEAGSGCWSDRVSHVARRLGLVSFDTEGDYEGYTSTEKSYPDNEIQIQERAWFRYLEKSPLQKERALLKALVQDTPNDFFEEATLVPGTAFHGYAKGSGPLSGMNLVDIRRRILALLGTLEAGVWYEFGDVVDLLGSRHPDLILDRANRKPDDASSRRLRDWEWEQRTVRRKTARGKKKARAEKPEVVLEDLYTGLHESDASKDLWNVSAQRPLTSETPGVFRRVEGRYLEFFLREIPYLLGFVDLGYLPDSDPHGLEVTPPFERLRAIRLTQRFASFTRAEKDFGSVKVTVLPTFEILLESESYPDSTLDRLAPLTRPLGEDGPIHTLKLDRKRIAHAVAEDAKLQPAKLLETLAGRPLPQNVLFDLDASASRGDRFVLYEGFGLLEMLGDDQAKNAALRAAGDLVEDTSLAGFALVREPKRVFERLETKHLVPVVVHHREKGFAPCAGRLASAPEGPARKATPKTPTVTKVRAVKEDLVGYRSTSAPLLQALLETLRRGKGTCVLAENDLLVVSTSRLPALRKALVDLAERFEVTIEDAP